MFNQTKQFLGADMILGSKKVTIFFAVHPQIRLSTIFNKDMQQRQVV